MRLDRKPEALVDATSVIRMGKQLRLDYRNAPDREAAELLVDAHYVAADLIRQTNDRARLLEAEAYINEGLTGAERLHKDHVGRPQLRKKVATMYLARGDLRRWQAERAAAYEDYRTARKHREEVMKADPSDLTTKAEFAFSLIKTGEELNALRRPEEAIAEFEIADQLYNELLGARPNDRSYLHWLWTTLQGLGESYRLTKSQKAFDYHRKKLSIAKARYDNSPESVDVLLSLAESHLESGDALIGHGAIENGLENLSTARELLNRKLTNPKVDWRLIRVQARVLEGIARGELTQRKYKEARKVADEAYALREWDKARVGKIDPHGQAEFAENRRLVGSILIASVKCEEAKSFYEQAAAILDKLVNEHISPNPEWQEQYGIARKSLAAIQWKDGSLECCNEPADPKLRDMIAMVTKRLP